jgi:CheY-like chemotaxis protein
MHSLPKTVLLVDDDLNERLLFARCAQKAGVGYLLKMVENGGEALAYLTGTGVYGDRTQFPKPDLMVLDINMPSMTGFEVLKWVRGQSSWCTQPVAMFSTSSQQADIRKAYELGANSYLLKPGNMDGRFEIVKMIEAYWLNLNRTAATAERAQAPLPVG